MSLDVLLDTSRQPIEGLRAIHQPNAKSLSRKNLAGRHKNMNGAGEESRTPDLRITNALLYQLSYTGVKPTIIAAR